MRLEQIPLLIGVLVAILGLGMVLDAQLPDRAMPSRERRRRDRAERHRGGEALVGLGKISLLETGNSRQAEQQWMLALSRNPNNAEARQLLAELKRRESESQPASEGAAVQP